MVPSVSDVDLNEAYSLEKTREEGESATDSNNNRKKRLHGLLERILASDDSSLTAAVEMNLEHYAHYSALERRIRVLEERGHRKFISDESESSKKVRPSSRQKSSD